MDAWWGGQGRHQDQAQGRYVVLSLPDEQRPDQQERRCHPTENPRCPGEPRRLAQAVPQRQPGRRQ